MPRDFKVYFEDILEAISKIYQFTQGLSPESFSGDQKTLDAVIRNLEIVGEAAKNIPEDIRNKYPAIEWKKIAGLRDILIHEYYGIDIDIVWDIVKNKLPELEKHLQKLLVE